MTHPWKYFYMAASPTISDQTGSKFHFKVAKWSSKAAKWSSKAAKWSSKVAEWCATLKVKCQHSRRQQTMMSPGLGTNTLCNQSRTRIQNTATVKGLRPVHKGKPLHYII